MPDKMSAEERLHPHALYASDLHAASEGVGLFRVVRMKEAMESCKAHAAAAVAESQARVAELETALGYAQVEIDKASRELNEVWADRHTVAGERDAAISLVAELEAEVGRLRNATLIERIAQITAHRACCGTEHDPASGKLHGYCVVCGVPWPCEYVGVPPQRNLVPQAPPARKEEA